MKKGDAISLASPKKQPLRLISSFNDADGQIL
jgi:hypothetical protein